MTEHPVTMREAGFTRMETLYLIGVALRPENRDQD